MARLKSWRSGGRHELCAPSISSARLSCRYRSRPTATCVCATSTQVKMADFVVPKGTWENAGPSEVGWSLQKLEEARQFFLALPASSMIVVDRGWVVVEWGDPAKRIKLSSVRKSILSALWLKLLRPSAGSSAPRQLAGRGSCHRTLLRAGAILRRRAFFAARDMPGGPAAIVGELPRVGP